MVDDQGSRIGHGAGVGNLAGDERLERTIGADGIGQDKSGRVDTLPRIDQVYVLGAGVDIAQILCIGRNRRVLRQGQLAVAIGIYEYSLAGIVQASAASLNGVDKGAAGN